MKPAVDKDKCTGCGTCMALCPKVFEFDDDGKSRVIDESGCAKGCDCQQAVDSCPTQAISLK
ncbi:ferredoxin [Patescibacteria group bacterium]|nr:ferredoxin [Patescibacteria group bacterium]